MGNENKILFEDYHICVNGFHGLIGDPETFVLNNIRDLIEKNINGFFSPLEDCYNIYTLHRKKQLEKEGVKVSIEKVPALAEFNRLNDVKFVSALGKRPLTEVSNYGYFSIEPFQLVQVWCHFDFALVTEDRGTIERGRDIHLRFKNCEEARKLGKPIEEDKSPFLWTFPINKVKFIGTTLGF